MKNPIGSVIAIFASFILIFLFAVILILNLAPDSTVAIYVDNIIDILRGEMS